MRVVVLALAAMSLLGGCMYIKVDDTGDDHGRSHEVTDCSKPDVAACKPE